ncbi:hypothetical protein AcW1_009401 [Taiwanofungus camphoratus]|nr:hypothetical protein AcW1_009401 [Antrodia cinnamomea]
MFLSRKVAKLLCVSLLGLKVGQGANSFAGSNLYYAAGLNDNDSTTILQGLSDARMKVLRVWLDGQSSSQQGTNINTFPDLEPNQICNGDTSYYDDTVLQRLDDFMMAARSYGIKLLISMHSFNALQARDVYGREYGTAVEGTERLYFCFEAENEAMIRKGQQYIQDHQW